MSRKAKPTLSSLLEFVKEEFKNPPSVTNTLEPVDIIFGDADFLPPEWPVSAISDFLAARTSPTVKLAGERKERNVVVKKIRWATITDMDKAKKVVSQVKIWEELTLRKPHPNILPLLGVFVNKTVNLVTEFTENGTVSMFLESKTKGGIEAFRVVKGIAAGLEHMHSLDMIHGDLKCSRVMMSSSGEPLITGFDVSSWAHLSVSSTWVNLCTPAYSAPEIVAPGKQAHTKASDMWSYGVVVCEILGGDIYRIPVPRDDDSTDKIPLQHPGQSQDPGKYYNGLWKIYVQCCVIASKRPTSRKVLESLAALESDSVPTPGINKESERT